MGSEWVDNTIISYGRAAVICGEFGVANDIDGITVAIFINLLYMYIGLLVKLLLY